MDNMRIYNQVKAVPDNAKKSFNNGRFRGTDINPMWRIKKLTELFGPAGIGWYIEVIRREIVPVEKELFAIVDINLYIKDGGEWSKPIYGTGGNKLLAETKSGMSLSDEGFKMAYTDAISVACKALGIAADVYFERDKSSKYEQYHTEDDGAPPIPRDRTGLITQENLKKLLLLCNKEQINWMLSKCGVEQLHQIPDEKALGYIAQMEARNNEGKGQTA